MKDVKRRIQICPKCGNAFTGVPATSREDGQTRICPDCGTRESLQSLGVCAEEQEKILSIIHRHYDN